MEDVLQSISKAEQLAYIGKHVEASTVLHSLKKQLPSHHAAQLLICVKLSRCYEYIDDQENCAKYWDLALSKQNDKLTDLVYERGLAELYLNQLRAQHSKNGITNSELQDKFEQVEKSFKKFRKTIQYAQFLYMKSKFYLNSENELCASICAECSSLAKNLQDEINNGAELVDGAKKELSKYLTELQHQVMQVQKFVALQNGQVAVNEKQHEPAEELEDIEENDEDDFEEANIKE